LMTTVYLFDHFVSQALSGLLGDTPVNALG
jgi:hypothetical protein